MFRNYLVVVEYIYVRGIGWGEGLVIDEMIRIKKIMIMEFLFLWN